ncbi:dihydrodipicolinate synthase family protein [Acuticoccus kandeliae]|uniref:dihydrodipicolinate synthase family protein n=1 Tax=Acuticoccus kandeliae TaxID=2073160 RepID=UPI000D3E59A0|nr:dihydrodipicolinate synthase family protein [Acuticoccus kandeliae]
MTGRKRTRGVYPVLYAFWNEDGSLDEGAMRVEIEHCLAEGAHGIMVLGLVTEVHKMTSAERRHLVETVGRLLAGRLPYAVTIGETSAADQVAFAEMAAGAGADWVILQPPPSGTREEVMAFFGAVADAVSLPVAIQNNPVNLAVSLESDDLVALHRTHPNISILKAEGFSVEIARAIAGAEGALDVFGGHGGIEYPALMRSGGTGLIPAPDFLAVQVRMFALMEEGSEAAWAEAERLHEMILPAIVFMSRSIPGMLCYGKRLMAEKLGLPVHDRAPFLAPTPFGMEEMGRALARIRAAEARVRMASAA